MEEEKKLYPLKFHPIAETFAWGGERIAGRYAKSFVVSDDQGHESKLEVGAKVAQCHEIADLGYRDSLIRDGWLAGNSISEVMDMYVDRVVGDHVFESYGRQFPVGIRFIDATSRTPLMVHPDDTIAAERYDFLGKSKLWYVIEASKDARIYTGFRRDVTAAELYSACQDGTVRELLHSTAVRGGEHFLITPGTVHAAEGVLMLEVAESSPLDFCLYNWGTDTSEDEFDETLGLVEALDFINYTAHPGMQPAQSDGIVSRLCQEREFTVSSIKLSSGLQINSESFDSFLIYTCVAGRASLKVTQEDCAGEYTLRAGETVLVPAEVQEFVLAPLAARTQLIEVMVERHEEPDEYINPNAAAETGDAD